MSTEAVHRDLGEILAHGDPEHGMGQGEAADEADAQAFWDGTVPSGMPDRSQDAAAEDDAEPTDERSAQGNGVIVDFRRLGPDAA